MKTVRYRDAENRNHTALVLAEYPVRPGEQRPRIDLAVAIDGATVTWRDVIHRYDVTDTEREVPTPLGPVRRRGFWPGTPHYL